MKNSFEPSSCLRSCIVSRVLLCLLPVQPCTDSKGIVNLILSEQFIAILSFLKPIFKSLRTAGIVFNKIEITRMRRKKSANPFISFVLNRYLSEILSLTYCELTVQRTAFGQDILKDS